MYIMLVYWEADSGLMRLSLVFQIPIRWPESRDEVWKANIPHTHLAKEKSDQNWMVVDGDRIKFPGGGTHFHYGADKYISALAVVCCYLCHPFHNFVFFVSTPLKAFHGF